MTLFWFRRDLRITDNAGLFHALKNHQNVQCIFIFDNDILKHLPLNDKRMSILYDFVHSLDRELQKLGSSLKTFHGDVESVFSQLLQTEQIDAVYTNHDYEPYAIVRDNKIHSLLHATKTPFYTFKDQCIFEKSEITKDDGTPYTVFTPYMKKWKTTLKPIHYEAYATEMYFQHLAKSPTANLPALESLGFERVEYNISDPSLDQLSISNYHETRDYPALIKGTSKLSVHLRFGTVSIRQLVSIGLEKNETWLNELIWRDFYMMILYQFPHVSKQAFKPKYDRIIWNNNMEDYRKWCEGKTGYPLVDAGMRELNTTGYMHNRVRMVVASFLTKHLLIDWRMGEKYFAEKLIDFDLSANNGGWQWAAGSGCDAAPYFRIFNPTEQTKKFDQAFFYIKKWVPEYLSLNYRPMIDHTFARNRCLKVYKEALEGN